MIRLARKKNNMRVWVRLIRPQSCHVLGTFFLCHQHNNLGLH